MEIEFKNEICDLDVFADDNPDRISIDDLETVKKLGLIDQWPRCKVCNELLNPAKFALIPFVVQRAMFIQKICDNCTCIGRELQREIAERDKLNGNKIHPKTR